MKNLKLFSGALLLGAVLSALVSCDSLFTKPGDGLGSIVLSFDDSVPMLTRAAQLPDVDDFNVNVSASDGKIVYDGKYSAMPEKLDIEAGNYTVSAVSRAFETPAYDAPQFGDSKVVSVKSGQVASVVLHCRQMNAGLLISADAAFKSSFPKGNITLRGPGGNLLWDYTESRTAYFRPGSVSLLLNDGNGKEECLCTRVLEAAKMLSLKLSASEDKILASGSGVVLMLDTLRNWTSDCIVVGGSNPGASSDNALSVTVARERIGEEKVWVQGYIVGVATSTSKMTTTPPFTKNTNMIIGLRSTTINPDYCMSVELPLGDIRDALNLVDNQSNRGKKVYIRGDIVAAYYGLPGLKNVSEFKWE